MALIAQPEISPVPITHGNVAVIISPIMAIGAAAIAQLVSDYRVIHMS